MGKKLAKSEIMQRVAEYEALILMGAAKNFERILYIGMGLKGIKDLADEVSWKALGYKDFEDYTVTKWNMAKVQAYKYLHVAERLPKNLVQLLNFSSKASVERLLSLLPNDQIELNLTPEEIEELMLLPPDEFKKELAEITGYDRSKHGGRGPSDIERPRISRDRYRDQQKKITQLKEKFNTTLVEKDELVGEIEKMEKLIEDLKKSGTDRTKEELRIENRRLLDLMSKIETENTTGRLMAYFGQAAIERTMDLAIKSQSEIFSKLGDLQLKTHDEWVQFRLYTDLIRDFLVSAEERVAAWMYEEGGLNAAEIDREHGLYAQGADAATKHLRDEYIKKHQKSIDETIEKAKGDRQKRRKKK